MQEALDLGFLDVHGKKTDSTSVRMTHEALQAIDALAAINKESPVARTTELDVQNLGVNEQ